ncbi:MAG TPA: hypothetical protein VJ302_20560 [Blastocatellia bacterium]|nr:hypothetical protein [Blastocatellia bacterium]
MIIKRFVQASVVCALLCSWFALGRAQEQPLAEAEAEHAGAAASTHSECKICRWVEIETAKISARYLFVDDSEGHIEAKQSQHQELFEGRFKFDPAGRLALHAGVFTGNNFAGGWNDTGLGKRTRGSANLYLKQLYLSAEPIHGVEIDYGGLGILNGESSGITGYAGDGYLVGERLVVRRPENLFFDQIAVTYAYLGDYFTPNLNKRYHRLKQSNYHQFLIGKKIGNRAAVSGEYTFQEGRETLRQAIRIKTPELRFLDTVRFENYQRTDVQAAYGFALAGEKKLFHRLTLGGGITQVDRNFGPFNDDAFFDGRRFFVSSELEVSPEFSFSLLYNRAVANNYDVGNRTHFHIAVHYDLLRSLKRTGIF